MGVLSALVITSAFFSSCSDNELPEDTSEKQRLILIYAVAANNLQPNLSLDLGEILQVAPNLNLKNNAVLAYYVTNEAKCKLVKLQKNASTGKFEFSLVQEFPELPLSTSQERINEVLGYVEQNYDYPKKGLVLWSHADGWIPWEGGSTPQNAPKRSFGMDNFQGATYKTNITDLADAIPPGMFDFIWFDCCYMGNIETVYQLREKADYIVGSVLEIASDGMPYQLTMPYLLREQPQLERAAAELYNYYNNSSVAVSVSVIDCSQLPLLAEATGKIFETGIAPDANVLNTIQTYQRSLPVRFYDMGQLLNSYEDIDADLKTQLADAFDRTVIYKAISKRDFNNRDINVKDYSGLSMHHYEDNGSLYNLYYTELDWFAATQRNN